MIKIVIPTDGKKGLAEKVAAHFGRCQTYTFLDEKGEVVEIIKNTSEHMGGTGMPPELMKQHKADVLLCQDLGPKALELCSQLSIVVYLSEVKTVREIFEQWKNKNLRKAVAQDTCHQHIL